MNWVCLHDQHRLNRQSDRLICGHCGRSYDDREGIFVFTRDDQDKESVNRQLPFLEELRQLMQQYSSDEAAGIFCRKHQCTRDRKSADWKFFFSVPEGSHVLEIGAGFGDDTADLTTKAGKTISIVPNMGNALIVAKHLREKELANTEVAVLRDITHLPLADHSITAIAMEDSAASGFNVTNRNFALIAAEWRRIVAPGGSVFLGLRNPWDTLLGFRFLRSKMQSRDYPQSLNRLVKRSSAARRHGHLGLHRTIGCMVQQGFNEPAIYAPFPDVNKTEVVVPVDDARAVRYFLNNLIRKNSFIVRVAVSMLNVFLTLHVFRYLCPYYFLYFRLNGDSEKSIRVKAQS